MVAVTSAATGLPYGRPLTAEDLDAMPDDGHRYELLDGLLLVSPAPGAPHQSTLGQLHVRLHTACPPELYVMLAPFDVRLAADTVLQPDLLVARRSDFTRRDLPVAPLLAVEIRSPSTALVDRTLKRAAYARHGVSRYWLVDPDPGAPSVTVLELRGDEYDEALIVRGDTELLVREPFPVRLRPSELVVRLPD